MNSSCRHVKTWDSTSLLREDRTSLAMSPSVLSAREWNSAQEIFGWMETILEESWQKMKMMMMLRMFSLRLETFWMENLRIRSGKRRRKREKKERRKGKRD